MSVHLIEAEQFLPLSIEEAWDFFSRPENLTKITPKEMALKITSKNQQGAIYAGQLITYTLKPILGIPINWMTEITHVRDLQYFIDEQRFGPYVLWHHEHFFKEVAGGVLMSDRVYYQLPLGFLGNFAHFLFVKRQVRQIFEYRKEQIEHLFPSKN